MSNLIAILLLVSGADLEAGGTQPQFQAWWTDSLRQVLVEDVVPESPLLGRLHAARGEFEAIQVAVRSETVRRVRLRAAPFCPGLPVRVRTVGRVPIRRGTHHTPNAERVAEPPVDLPDPLFPGDMLELQANKTECFWLDVEVPVTTEPGEYRTKIEVSSEGTSVEMFLVLKVHQATVPFEGKLLLTNWFSTRPKELGFGDVPAGSDAWFACANLLFDSMWAHRQNMFWTPLGPPFIQPIVSVDGELEFDFTLFDAWVEAFSRPRGGSRKTYIEGQPIAWREGYDGHVKARIWRIVDGKPQQAIIEVTDPAARGLSRLLGALRDHLKEKDWLERFRIHITDEPHRHQLEPYAVVAGYVREFSPEFHIMEALDVRDDFEFFEKHCDVWVPQLGRFDKTLDRMLERLAQGREVWIYTCLFPNGAYPNRFVDYPLIKTRVLHWINFRWGFTGYLHWGFNQWRGDDPFKDLEPAHGGSTFLPPGDAWIVYPGDRQLLDSIRHEAMRDGVEDFELLVLLAEKDPKKARTLAQTVVRSFTDYVHDPQTLNQVRLELLEALD